MRETTLWLLGLMACLPVCSLAALQVLAAPNKLRLETPENIFVECQDCSGPGPIRVTINVLTFPTKARLLTSNRVNLTKDDNYQKLEQIMIPAEDFKKDPNLKQYVYLQAQFGGLENVVEKVVMVSFQSGFIFIQTDKTIYTPDSRVQYRLFAVTPGMDPIETGAGGYVNVEIENPQGLSLSLTEGVLIKGIKSGKYQIPKIASLGVWKVVASFINNPQETFSANFEVKEYVLPSIEVKLVPVKSFFYVNSTRFDVNIEAKYLYGKAVDGEAYVVFGVIHDNEKMSFPRSFKRVPLINGRGKATLEMQHITHTFPEINELVGSAIYVTVSVLTASGSDMVEAEKRGIHIVTSPYKIDLKKTPKYFKPGMPLDVSIHVMNPDNTPAPNVEVMLIIGTKRQHVKTDLNGNGKTPFNIEETQTSNMDITAETTLALTEGSQSRATMTVQPYQSRSQNHLHIGVETSGNAIVVTFYSGSPAMSAMAEYDITYLILSKGRILDVGRLRSVGQTVMKHTLPVTKAMLPSFRLIAYYHVNTTEVVSDSLLVDVKETCMGSLKIESHTGDTYEPGDTLRLKVTGDPGARVGLVAVDKAVYVLNNKHRLTQKKVWGIMERYDTGCTPGGGNDSMGVFYDAGLLFATTTNLETLDRTDPNCPVSTRRKRSVTIGDVKTTLVRQYSDEWQRKCCLDGMKNTPLSYDCQRRSEYITENQTCVDAFMNCCTQLANQREASKKQEELYLARSEDMKDKDIDRYANDITSRTDFPESWLWIEIDLPNCAENSKCIYLDTDRGGEKLRDSITTWEISGISLSNSYGICVSEPLEVIVKKKFFIDLRLPYSAVQGEQLEIKAILHNLGNDEELEVHLDLIDNVHVCSLASKRRKYRQKVLIRGTTMAVPFNIIPMKEGRQRIEVKAIVPKYYGGDGIVKELLVMPMGVLTRHTEERTLKPAEHGGTLTRRIENNFNKTDMVPSTPTYTNISMTAHHLSALLESALSGTAMETLIRKPSGVVNRKMFEMTALVIATTYLDKTQKWEDVGFIKKRNGALEHIHSGYTDHLGYRRAEGCFVFYRDNKCSTWLTAYTVKVFAMVNQFVEVKSGVLCGAVKWLFQNAWNPDGSFQELGTALTSQTYLTAFTLISIQELESDCANYISSLPSKINKTVAYLKNNLRTLKNNPYAVAMTSYALANANQLDREILFSSSSGGGNYWLAPGDVLQWGRQWWSNKAPISITLEATGYALLALLKAKAFRDAKPIVSWLNQQRDHYGAYGSTQATMVVYQALAEYWSIVPEDPFDLDVEIQVVGRSRKLPTWKFTRENSFTTRSTQVNRIEALDVTAKGTGEVTISVMSLYYAQPKIDGLMDNCEKFNLTVTLNLVKTDEAGDIYMLEMNFRNKVKDNDATMTILDIGLPTGFVADHSQLESLSTGVDRTISKYEIDSLLSETKKDKGSIIMYLDKVSNAKTEQIRFNIIKKMKVGNLQPAAVSMYEYYNEKLCVKFYHPETENRQIQTLCRSDSNVCLCAEENCSKQKKDKVTDETRNIERFNMACRKEDNNQTEYVYKVRVVDVQHGKSADVYRMCIEEPIKEGADMAVEWRLRTFLSLPQCRDSLGLEKNKTYLIMGMNHDVHKNDKASERETSCTPATMSLSPTVSQSNGYEYVIGERTWVEYWPSPAECKVTGSKHRRVCNALKKLIRDLDIIGCPDA